MNWLTIPKNVIFIKKANWSKSKASSKVNSVPPEIINDPIMLSCYVSVIATKPS